jgi:anti-sigma28 factor (negative regulator of flagellin synthesis)
MREKISEERRKRIAEIARLIRAGEYHVPAELVAESILFWRGRSGRNN